MNVFELYLMFVLLKNIRKEMTTLKLKATYSDLVSLILDLKKTLIKKTNRKKNL